MVNEKEIEEIKQKLKFLNRLITETKSEAILARILISIDEENKKLDVLTNKVDFVIVHQIEPVKKISFFGIFFLYFKNFLRLRNDK